MIGGMDAERGTVTAGGRGYYLMVRFRKRNTINNTQLTIEARVRDPLDQKGARVRDHATSSSHFS